MSSWHLKLLNKMELLRGKTVSCKRWLGSCSIARKSLETFGLKRSIPLAMCLIEFLEDPAQNKRPVSFGKARSLMLVTSIPLGVNVIF